MNKIIRTLFFVKEEAEECSVTLSGAIDIYL